MGSESDLQNINTLCRYRDLEVAELWFVFRDAYPPSMIPPDDRVREGIVFEYANYYEVGQSDSRRFTSIFFCSSFSLAASVAILGSFVATWLNNPLGNRCVPDVGREFLSFIRDRLR